MTSFTLIVVMGVLMILGGISLLATPILNFISAGYFIIVLFFFWGIYGIIQGISEKRYDKNFFFSILSLILGIIGVSVPGVAEMNNSILLYLAGGWFLIHGVMSIIDAIGIKKQGADTFTWIICIILGVLELLLAIYSIAHPALLAINIGLLIAFYFIESGVDLIAAGKAVCKGGNNMTILLTAIGVVSIIAGISLLATPLLTYLGAGPCIIMLFFMSGIVGIVRAIMEHRYDKNFFLAILALILGIIGVTVPGMAAMTDSILLYLAGGWFLLHGVLTIVDAIAGKKAGADTGTMIFGIVLGIIELILAIYSIAHPAVLAISIGLLIGFYFIEQGIRLIVVGSGISQGATVVRE